MTMTTRRDALIATAAGLAAGGSAVPALAQRRRVDPGSLIPTTPADGLRGFMRLFAGTSGSCVFTNEGIIYGKADGELPKPLFGFLSAVEIKPVEISPGVFRSEQKEAMVYLELGTRRLLTAWKNPYTGEDLIPFGYVSPNNVYFFDETGSYARQLPENRSGRKALDWRTSSSEIWVTEQRFNNFPSGITEAEFPRAYSGPVRRSVDILTYRAKAEDFANPRLASVPSDLGMVTDGPWPLFMMMAKRPGGVIWHGFGQKYARFADMPAANRDPIEQAYAGFLADPWGFNSAEWGTAAQMRRLRAQGKL
jgi:hypothetical protein